MRDNGLLLGELKQLHNRFTTAADRYFNEFASMVDTEQKKMDMFNDMDGCVTAMQKTAETENISIIQYAQQFARENFSIENYGAKILKVYGKVLNRAIK